MRGKSSPANRACEAELVERPRIVSADAPRQYASFPGIRGRLETLKLSQRLKHSPFAQELRPGRHVLPAQEPPHELRRGHRFDLFAQRPQRQSMDTRQEAPITPLRFAGGRIRETPTQNGAARLHS